MRRVNKILSRHSSFRSAFNSDGFHTPSSASFIFLSELHLGLLIELCVTLFVRK